MMELNALMANQLQSLQSTVQMSVLNRAMNMDAAAVTDMLESMPDTQQPAVHPHKGTSIDVKA